MKVVDLLESKGEYIKDAAGKPLVLYRGLHGDAMHGISPDALKGKPRSGYATFLSSSHHTANTYSTPHFDRSERETGAMVPVYVKATKIIEFPTKTEKHGGKSFDKFEFDRRAQNLSPGEVLVVRGIVDVGPRAHNTVDPEMRWSYPNDVYAIGKGTTVVTAIRKKPVK